MGMWIDVFIKLERKDSGGIDIGNHVYDPYAIPYVSTSIHWDIE